MFSSLHLLRRSHKTEVNVEDFLKNALKFLHANAHSDVPHVNSRMLICFAPIWLKALLPRFDKSCQLLRF